MQKGCKVVEKRKEEAKIKNWNLCGSNPEKYEKNDYLLLMIFSVLMMLIKINLVKKNNVN